MNLKEFMDNPAGKGDSSMTNRTMLREMLDFQYDILIRDKQIKCKFYNVLGKNRWFILVTVPTTKERDNSYDIVFLFTDDENQHSSDSTIINYDIQVFSNCPAFVYTFAKVYYDNKLFIKQLAGKLPKECLTKNPEVRNKYGIINYDKYLYFATKYLYDSRTLLNKTTLPLRSISYSPQMLDHDVRSFDTIMNEYQKAVKKVKRNNADDRDVKSSRSNRGTESTVKKKQPKSKTSKIKKPKNFKVVKK